MENQSPLTPQISLINSRSSTAQFENCFGTPMKLEFDHQWSPISVHASSNDCTTSMTSIFGQMKNPTPDLQVAQGARRQFLRTKMCPFLSKGTCSNAKFCSYAHSQDQLRPFPDLRQTKLCEETKKGFPCNNPHCAYAHAIYELKPTPDLITYKTSLCFFWKKSKCLNESKCRFAHGVHELRHKKSTDDDVINDRRTSVLKSKRDFSKNFSLVDRAQHPNIQHMVSPSEIGALNKPSSYNEPSSELTLTMLQQFLNAQQDPTLSALQSLLSSLPLSIDEKSEQQQHRAWPLNAPTHCSDSSLTPPLSPLGTYCGDWIDQFQDLQKPMEPLWASNPITVPPVPTFPHGSSEDQISSVLQTLLKAE